MNCEPGDLAVIVRSNSILVEIPPGSEAWIQDSDLKPLRDPGPEAVDETLLPFKETA